MDDETRTNDRIETTANTAPGVPTPPQHAAPPAPAGGAASFPEPVILEEHVIAPAAPKQAPAPIPAPAPRVSPPSAPVSPSAPPTPAPAASPAIPQTPKPVVPERSMPITIVPPSMSGLQQTPASQKQPAPPIPAVPVPTSAPTPSPVVPPVRNVMPQAQEPKPKPTPVRDAMLPTQMPTEKTPAPVPPHQQSRITNILSSVKLPERRGPTANQKEEPRPVPNIMEQQHEVTRVPTTPVAQTPPQSGSTIHSVHTLKDDLQEVVRENKISVVRAAALEQQKRHGQEHLIDEATPVRRPRRTRWILFVSGLLVLLGALAIAGVYYAQQQSAANRASVTQGSSLLFAENTVTFPLSSQSPRELKQLLAQTRNSQLGSLGSITRILPVIAATTSNGAQQTPATLQQFFDAIGVTPPDELMRAIGPDFFFGIHTVDTNAPLFVISVSSYDHAFAGMLAWESTMNADLAPVFTAVPALTTNAQGLPVARQFEDGVLRNYDVRELKDDTGKIQLYYSFPTPNLLVIAESPYSFTEILSRLQAQRQL